MPQALTPDIEYKISDADSDFPQIKHWIVEIRDFSVDSDFLEEGRRLRDPKVGFIELYSMDPRIGNIHEAADADSQGLFNVVSSFYGSDGEPHKRFERQLGAVGVGIEELPALIYISNIHVLEEYKDTGLIESAINKALSDVGAMVGHEATDMPTGVAPVVVMHEEGSVHYHNTPKGLEKSFGQDELPPEDISTQSVSKELANWLGLSVWVGEGMVYDGGKESQRVGAQAAQMLGYSQEAAGKILARIEGDLYLEEVDCPVSSKEMDRRYLAVNKKIASFEEESDEDVLRRTIERSLSDGGPEQTQKLKELKLLLSEFEIPQVPELAAITKKIRGGSVIKGEVSGGTSEGPSANGKKPPGAG